MNIKTILLSLLILLNGTIKAQDYPQDAFISPLNIPLILSGTFAELRSNHFHSGIDIKTQGVEGKNVFCIADGFVSRIKVSPFGYGNAIYITHPNGYTSVYAHLQQFSTPIQKYVEQEQYRKKAFAVNLFPAKDAFRFKQGDIIALSGNSGGSAAPHLHFEIRNTNTEEPINPLLFGYKVSDNKHPVMQSLFIYPLDENSWVNGLQEKVRYALKKESGTNTYSIIGAPKVKGNIGFGIETYDCQDGAWNKNGVYSVELFQNNELFYEHKMECFAFYETRYINSLMDYSEKFCCNRKPQKSFIDPNNKLRVYEHVKNNGVLKVRNGQSYSLKYVVSDVVGNESSLNFEVDADPNSYQIEQAQPFGIHFPALQENRFDTEGLALKFPKGCFYTDIDFTYRRSISDSSRFLSHWHSLLPLETPVHERFEISIQPSMPIPSLLKDKATIVASDINMNNIHSVGGKWKNNALVANIRSMGTYGIFIDTIAPEITKISLQNGAYLKNGDLIEIKAKDLVSGISKYEAFIDDKWVLLAYDAKNSLFYHQMDDRTGAGKHEFEIRLTDSKNNTQTKLITFFK